MEQHDPERYNRRVIYPDKVRLNGSASSSTVFTPRPRLYLEDGFWLTCWYLTKEIVVYEDKLVSTTIPLDRMSTVDKLRALEEIWEDLSRNPENIPAPAWHDDALKARERRIEEGTATFEDWAEVKRRLFDRTR